MTQFFKSLDACSLSVVHITLLGHDLSVKSLRTADLVEKLGIKQPDHPVKPKKDFNFFLVVSSGQEARLSTLLT